MRLMSAFLACSLLAMSQTKAPTPEVQRGKAIVAAPSAAVPETPQFVKAADGKWRCMAVGKPCTAAQVQAVQGVTKSLSNIKNNVAISADGTLQCSNSGKPCSDAETQSAAAALTKAITKGGPQGY